MRVPWTQEFKPVNPKEINPEYSLEGGFPDGSDDEESACNVGDHVQSLGWEDPLEKEMATHSSVPAWEIPWTEEHGGLQSMGLQRVRQDLETKQQTQ